MRSDIYWIDGTQSGRLAIMARPRAGDWLEDEIASWRDAGVEVVVSLLEPGGVAELGLADEAGLCARHGIKFVGFPIPDRGVPAIEHDAVMLARQLAEQIGAGQSVAIHCRAGIGRSALMAACTLRILGMTTDTAFDA